MIRTCEQMVMNTRIIPIFMFLHSSNQMSGSFTNVNWIVLSISTRTDFFNDFRILCSARSDFELKITESLLIKKHKPLLNVKSTESWNHTLKLF